VSWLRILIVEDDPQMGALTRQGLIDQGYDVDVVGNGVDGLIAFGQNEFAAVAIDVMMPGMSGFELCRRIRDTGSSVPIILLTARDAIEDRVYGLDAGADDYLTKPFSISELGARLRAIFRRQNAGPQVQLSVGALLVDSIRTTVSVADRTVTMSPREFSLLRLLATTPGIPVSRAVMLEEIWGSVEHIDPNIVEQYISFLRRKLDPELARVAITTVRGVGYQLDELP
jgi:two-component system OmpR family response regulator